MQAALEFSFYVLGVVFTLGVLMVLLLVKDVFFHGRFNTYLPGVKRVPTTALDAARDTLGKLRAAQGSASGERRDSIAYEIKHLEHRISALEDKTYRDQADYYAAAQARERVWREWRSAHEAAREGGFARRREMRNELDELREQYRALDREVNEEYHRSVARDTLTLEELRSQGVLDPEVLRPPAEPTAAGTQAKPEDDGSQEQPVAPPRSGKWMTPLPSYQPAQGGVLAQADMARREAIKSERTYVEPTFSMASLPGGMLSGADLSRSSFGEVEFVGTHRFVNCTMLATDLRRIELKRSDQAHIFQDCDLRGSSLAQAHLVGVVFRRCNLSGTHWRSVRLDRVKFESCAIDAVHWEGADLSRTVMSEDMLARADFAFASKPPLNLQPRMESPPELPQPPESPLPAPAEAESVPPSEAAVGAEAAEVPQQPDQSAPAHPVELSPDGEAATRPPVPPSATTPPTPEE